MARSDTTEKSSDTRFFGQPWALVHIFGVEMWERFSFYGMQGILLIYMYYAVSEGGLGIDQSVAAGIVGAYGGTVYLSTILGAWLADRLLGSERVLFYSSLDHHQHISPTTTIIINPHPSNLPLPKPCNIQHPHLAMRSP